MDKLLLLAISTMFAGNAICANSLPELPDFEGQSTTVVTEDSDWVQKEKASFERQIERAKDQIYKCMHSYYTEAEIKAMGYYDEYDMVDKLDRKIQLLEKLIAIE